MASPRLPPAAPQPTASTPQRLARRLQIILEEDCVRERLQQRAPAITQFLAGALEGWSELWPELAAQLHSAKCRGSLSHSPSGLQEVVGDLLLPFVEDQLGFAREQQEEEHEQPPGQLADLVFAGELPEDDDVVTWICRRWFRELTRRKYLRPGTQDSNEEEDELMISEDDEDEQEGADEGDDDEDEEELEPGACLICERRMPLTRHHTIPRAVHKEYLKKGFTREVLNQTVAICRPCHSAVHRMADLRTLAAKYNTLELIMEHPRMQPWVAYIRKRRVYTREEAINPRLRYHK